MPRQAFACTALLSAALCLACSREDAPAPRGTAAPSQASGSSTAASSGASSASPGSEPTGSSSGASRAGASASGNPLNVLLITIDSMRADMPWQGYERPIAPYLTELAKQSVVYTRAYSIASYTAKSIAALLSGRYPSTLYRSGFFFTAYPDANLFFPELLQKAGIRTMAVHAHGYFDRGMKLEQGFDVWRMVPNLKWNAETDENVTAPQSTEIALELLSKPENTGQQFFFWMQYGDPHDQYVIHPECPDWGHDNRDRYDSEICFVDLHVKKLLEWAKTQPWADRTAIIIGSDHGESFGEHNQWKHAFALWEGLVHVPLMVKLRTIDARRSYLDLTPTIMELMGQPSDPGFVGKSMVPELYGKEPAASREPIVLDLPADSYNPETKALLQGDYKLIYEGAANRFRLYDLKADPGELADLAKLAPHKAKRQELEQLHQQIWSAIPTVKPFGGNKLVGGGRANGPEGPNK
jgi:choline-sulfatase